MTDKLISDLGAIGAAIADNTAFEAQRNGQTTTEQALASDIKTYIKSALMPLLAQQIPNFSNAATYLANANSGGSNTAMTANTLYQGFIVVPVARTFTSFGFVLGTLAGTSSIRAGIYNVSAAGIPTTLVVDLGTIDSSTGTGSTGIKTLSTSTLLNPGVYALCIVSDGIPSIHMHSNNFGTLLSPVLTGGNWFAQRGLFRTFTFAALPADESAQTYTGSSSAFPLLGIR